VDGGDALDARAVHELDGRQLLDQRRVAVERIGQPLVANSEDLVAVDHLRRTGGDGQTRRRAWTLQGPAHLRLAARHFSVRVAAFENAYGDKDYERAISDQTHAAAASRLSFVP